MQPVKRRGFVRTAGAAALASACPAIATAMSRVPQPSISGGNGRPNILLIMTDQQHAGMLGCAGNPWLQTPALDGLAARGVRFERAYCANPVCVPSRFTMFTGRMPSVIGMRGNGTRHITEIPAEIRAGGLGWLMRNAGYTTAYGGKQHLPKMRAEELGFDVISYDERAQLPDDCAAFLQRAHTQPFFLVASFINPHDICYMAIRAFGATPMERMLLEKGAVELATLDRALQCPADVSDDEFFARYCPPLPPNFEVQDDEPEAIARMQAERPFMQRARAEWSERDWRLHRWAYARLTEFADAQIGRLLATLRASGHEQNTLVIFTSDHGDLDSAHRMEHKSAMYEEAARVPLIVSGPGVAGAGRVDRTHLVSSGLDLLPTLCGIAGAPVPANMHGMDFTPLLRGAPAADWRTHLVMESELGRMVRSARYKYALHDAGAHREHLYDLQRDPYETRNCVLDADRAQARDEHRRVLREWVARTGDGMAAEYLI